MDMLKSFKTTGRAALIAIALGATAFTAMPAQAAGPSPSFSLQLGNGNGYGNGPSFSGGNGSIQLQFGDNFLNYCLTNGEIKEELRDYGFKSVQIVKKVNNRKVIAVGRYKGTWYEMRVDRCTGKVDKVKKVKQNTNGNFSITLSF